MNVKKVILHIALIISASYSFSLTVEVVDIIDPPDAIFPEFAGDAVAFFADGRMLLQNSTTVNIYLYKNHTWQPLLKKYTFNENNSINKDYFHSEMRSSRIKNEFLYSIESNFGPQECYRIYVNKAQDVCIELVSLDYYSKNRTNNIGSGFDLLSGKKVLLSQSEDGEYSYYPKLIDDKGKVLYEFMQLFRNGFVEWLTTIEISPDKKYVTMVISYTPDESSPQFNSSEPRCNKLVVFKIDYD